MIDKIKIMAEVPNPGFLLSNFKWRDVEIEDQPMIKCSQANLSNKSRMFSLRMLLTENLRTGLYSLSIDGSIRKWYFDNNSRRDLTPDEFTDSVKLLGEKLGLKKNEVWSFFKITNLEVGVTLLLKYFTNDILDCFVKYRNARRDIQYVTTLYFHFENYKIKMYDKSIEMNKGKIPSSNYANIQNKYLMLRFEIGGSKITGSPFNGKFGTFELIRTNWNSLPKLLEDYLQKIEFVDLVSKEKNVESKKWMEFTNELIFLGMKSKGIHQTIMDFNKLDIPNNKNYFFKKLMNNYITNISSERDYKAELLFELKKKTDRLYNKGNIKHITI